MYQKNINKILLAALALGSLNWLTIKSAQMAEEIKVSHPETEEKEIEVTSLENAKKSIAEMIESGDVVTAQLFHAAISNDTKLAQEALDKSADVNAKDPNFYTPLVWACLSNRTDMVKFLLEYNAEIDYCSSPEVYNTEMPTPIFAAYMTGSFEILKLLIDKVAQNEEFEDEIDCLLAVLANQSHTYEYSSTLDLDLIKSKFSEDEKIEVVKYLLNKINFLPSDLFLLSVNCSFEMAKTVINSPHFDVNKYYISANEEAMTPLELAISLKEFEIAKYLIFNMGANISYVYKLFNQHTKQIENDSEISPLILHTLIAGNKPFLLYLFSLGLKIPEKLTTDPLRYFNNEYSLDNRISDWDEDFLDYMISNYKDMMNKLPLFYWIFKDCKQPKRENFIDVLLKHNFDIKESVSMQYDELSMNYAIFNYVDLSQIKVLIKAGFEISEQDCLTKRHKVFHNINLVVGSKLSKYLLDLLKFYPLQINNHDIEAANLLTESKPISAAKALIIRKRSNEHWQQLFNLINHQNTSEKDAIASLKAFICNPNEKERVSLIAFDPTSGDSTLHHAVKCCKPHMVKLILQAAPALADLPDDKGKTPIDLMAGKHSVLKKLLKNGRPVTQAASENYNSTATAINSAGPGNGFGRGSGKGFGFGS